MNPQDEQDVEEIRVSMDNIKETVAMSKALHRLKKNADFKLLFTEGYQKEYVLRLIGLKAMPHTQGEKDQAFMAKRISAIGFMSAYMVYIEQQGRIAKETLVSHEEEQARILKGV